MEYPERTHALVCRVDRRTSKDKRSSVKALVDKKYKRYIKTSKKNKDVSFLRTR